MGKRSGFTAEEKLEAVLTLLRKEDTGAKTARRFGVSENTLYRWREQFLASGKSGLRNGASSEQKRIRELEKEVALIHKERAAFPERYSAWLKMRKERGLAAISEKLPEIGPNEHESGAGVTLKQRLELIDKHAKWLKKTPNKVWSRQQNKLPDS